MPFLAAQYERLGNRPFCSRALAARSGRNLDIRALEAHVQGAEPDSNEAIR